MRWEQRHCCVAVVYNHYTHRDRIKAIEWITLSTSLNDILVGYRWTTTAATTERIHIGWASLLQSWGNSRIELIQLIGTMRKPLKYYWANPFLGNISIINLWTFHRNIIISRSPLSSVLHPHSSEWWFIMRVELSWVLWVLRTYTGKGYRTLGMRSEYFILNQKSSSAYVSTTERTCSLRKDGNILCSILGCGTKVSISGKMSVYLMKCNLSLNSIFGTRHDTLYHLVSFPRQPRAQVKKWKGMEWNGTYTL